MILPINVVFFYCVFINYTFLYTDNTWLTFDVAAINSGISVGVSIYKYTRK
jgi:hypothetical protein